MAEDEEIVSHPKHYIRNGLEAIDVIKAFTSDLEGMYAYGTGNALKYMCRWKEKGGVQDLKKARWYISWMITELENLEGSRND